MPFAVRFVIVSALCPRVGCLRSRAIVYAFVGAFVSEVARRSRKQARHECGRAGARLPAARVRTWSSPRWRRLSQFR
eukprot:3391943-Prymnesium_polylepis.2